MSHTAGTAYGSNTLNGLIRLNDKNLADFEYSDIVQPTAFYKVLPWFAASNGTQHKFTMNSTAPGAAFRAINSGVLNVAGTDKTISLDLKAIDASFFRDVLLVKGHKDRSAYLQREAMRSLNAAFAKSEYQLIRGSGYDGSGYDGLQDLANLYDGNSVNVGGSGGARVYMMILGEDGVAGILGNDGEFNYTEPTLQRILTNVDGTGYNAYNVDITGWMGLQVAGKYSIAFAYNVDGTTGKGVTDDLIAELYAKFPSDRAPFVNCILISMAGLLQWQKSRTATNPTGAPAPFPAVWDAAGRPIPVVVSDAVNTSESTVTTTTTTSTTTTTAGG